MIPGNFPPNPYEEIKKRGPREIPSIDGPIPQNGDRDDNDIYINEEIYET